jgi:hypothetical protein
MMSEPKPLASLSSNLLARKGQAAPAMRRQGMISLMTEAAASGAAEHSELEDLGWNDMGHDSDYLPGQAGRAGLSPMTTSHEAHPAPQPQVAPISPSVEIQDVEPVVPEVVRQQQLVRETAVPAQSVVAEPSFSPKAAPKVANRAAPGSRGKAAFTLRLDADRHLQLRLACALNHRSAQQIVTEALDAYLGGLSIAEQLSAIRKTGKA